MRAARLLFLVLLLTPLTTPADAPRGARDADGRKAGGRSDDLGMSQYALSVVKAIETDHLEKTVLGEAQADGNKVIVSLEPGELKTLKLRYAGLASTEGN